MFAVAGQHCRLVDQAVFGPVVPAPSIIPVLNSTGGGATNGTTNTTVSTPFLYGTDIIRGVNLGGWFVLEVILAF